MSELSKNYTFGLIIEVLSQSVTEAACGSWLAVVLGIQSPLMLLLINFKLIDKLYNLLSVLTFQSAFTLSISLLSKINVRPVVTLSSQSGLIKA